MSKKVFKALLVFIFVLGLIFPAFADPGVGKLNIWISAPGNPCGTWNNNEKEVPWHWQITILDCDGIFKWPCGSYLHYEDGWKSVPDGAYTKLPFICGHLEVKLPPGTYWVVAAKSVNNHGHAGYIHLNQSTHVGIAQVQCDKTSCIKLFNPSIKICWNWFRYGMYMNEMFQSREVEKIDIMVTEMLKGVPNLPAESNIIKILDEQIMAVKKKRKMKK